MGIFLIIVYFTQVMTNLALLSMDKDVQAFAPNASSRDWILMFVVFEHIFLGIKYIIDKVIPDVPRVVSTFQPICLLLKKYIKTLL